LLFSRIIVTRGALTFHLLAIWMFLSFAAGAPNMAITNDPPSPFYISVWQSESREFFSRWILPTSFWDTNGLCYRVGVSGLCFWTIKSNNPSPATYTLAIHTELQIGIDDQPMCATLPSDFGFSVLHNNGYELDVICSSDVFGVQASTYWFGDLHDQMDNLLTQVEYPTNTSRDLAATISWQNRPVAANGRDAVFLHLRWGNGSSHVPRLSISEVSNSGNTVYVSGTIDHEPENDKVTLFVVLDSILSTIWRMSDPRSPGSFSFSIVPSNHVWSLEEGDHVLSVYAVTDLGTFSPDTPSISLVRNSDTEYIPALLPTNPPVRTRTFGPSRRPTPPERRTSTPELTQSPDPSMTPMEPLVEPESVAVIIGFSVVLLVEIVVLVVSVVWIVGVCRAHRAEKEELANQSADTPKAAPVQIYAGPPQAYPAITGPPQTYGAPPQGYSPAPAGMAGPSVQRYSAAPVGMAGPPQAYGPPTSGYPAAPAGGQPPMDGTGGGGDPPGAGSGSPSADVCPV
jgi:hypothetical protein